jgi:hypothetical protein
MPSKEELDKRHYIGKGLNREVEKDRHYDGYKADVAEFNDLFMRGKMGLGIDELAEATINFARKCYSDLLLNEKTGELEKKLVGNTIKSKKMPVYIEKFLDKGIDLLLRKKGQEFLDSYYDYIEKIYNYQIPLREIASKGKIKKTLQQYKEDCNTLTVAGQKKSRQAWYELLLSQNPVPHVDIADVIYYINVGSKKSDSDVKRVTRFYSIIGGKKTDITKDVKRSFEKYKRKSKLMLRNKDNMEDDIFGMDSYDFENYLYKESDGSYAMKYLKLEVLTNEGKERQYLNSPYFTKDTGYENVFSEDDIYLNCKILDNKIIESEEDIMCSDDFEYNCDKYIEMFNKRIRPLLVCFKPEIRKRILIMNPNERNVFTEEECELDSGNPIRKSDQDTYEALMTPSRQEMEFWDKIGERPPFVDEIGMDWEKMIDDFHKLLEREKDKKFKIINEGYINAVENLTEEEIENFMEDGEIPSSMMKYVYINSDINDLNFYFKEIPDMQPTLYNYVGDINMSIIENRENEEDNEAI